GVEIGDQACFTGDSARRGDLDQVNVAAERPHVDVILAQALGNLVTREEVAVVVAENRQDRVAPDDAATLQKPVGNSQCIRTGFEDLYLVVDVSVARFETEQLAKLRGGLLRVDQQHTGGFVLRRTGKGINGHGERHEDHRGENDPLALEQNVRDVLQRDLVLFDLVPDRYSAIPIHKGEVL